MSQIILFSRPIRSGKTTELMDWQKGKNSVGGFLTPDVDGKRKLYFIKNKTWHQFQSEDKNQKLVNIGTFNFLESAFELGAETILKDAADCRYIILDEIGKLEMKRQSGWESALQSLLKIVQKSQSELSLILVVRDFLLEEFIQHYSIQNPIIVHNIIDLHYE